MNLIEIPKKNDYLAMLGSINIESNSSTSNENTSWACTGSCDCPCICTCDCPCSVTNGINDSIWDNL